MNCVCLWGATISKFIGQVIENISYWEKSEMSDFYSLPDRNYIDEVQFFRKNKILSESVLNSHVQCKFNTWNMPNVKTKYRIMES